MQTPANKHLISVIEKYLKAQQGFVPRILDIGAGSSLFVEERLAERECAYICDRADLEYCPVQHPNVDRIFTCSVEAMQPVDSEAYDLAFANYLLEHVPDLTLASSEMLRVLKPGNLCVVTVPNPTALEFVIARITPLWFHRFIRGGAAWETHYSYKNIKDLCSTFGSAGFELVDVAYYSCVEGYLERFTVVNILARFYDKILHCLKIKRFMGNVCIIFRKPEVK